MRSSATAVRSPNVRKAQPSDWEFIRELCCRTGNVGDPIDLERWPFFSELWVGPYQKLARDWAYIAEGENGRLGYLTGCPDTSAFDVKRRLWFDLPLVLRVKVLREFPTTSETRRFVRRTLRLEKGPEQCFDPEVLRELKRDYPAHLHTNVESFARGTGAGRALVEAYRKDLQAIGVNGIHLFCGERPIPFYQKVGFEVIDVIEFRRGVRVYALGSRF